VIPRNAPLTIWCDEGELDFTEEEREWVHDLEKEEGNIPLLGKMPAGAHYRPYGHDSLLVLWEHVHHTFKADALNPPPAIDTFHDMYTELVIRSLSKMVPGLKEYVGSKAFIDGGYYTKTPENIPLVGPLANLSNAFIIGGLSGYGIMSSNALGELCASYIVNGTQDTLLKFPSYASPMLPSRYMDRQYLEDALQGKVGGETKSSL
jgi:sarcosine oxidase subunit beta